MTDIKSTNDPNNIGFKDSDSSKAKEGSMESLPEKGPLSFLSGALTSALFAWISLQVSKNVVVYFTIHTNNYSSPIAQSVASGFKTLVIGMCFLATFTFGFIGLGLAIVFIRSLLPGKDQESQ